MAPTLWGEHLSVTCDQCGFPYRCDRRSVEAHNSSVCPNCGFADNPRNLHREEPSQRYIVDREFGNLKRWDIVAFQYPTGEDRAGQQGVKRIVGMPKETITFRYGMVWNGERPVGIDWQTTRDAMITVFDSRYQPNAQSGLPHRFEPRQGHQGWKKAGDCWSFQPGPTKTDTLSFIDYVHWRCCRHMHARTEPAPIEDYHPGDQSQSRTLHPVGQLYVAVDLDMSQQASFQLSIVRPAGTWTAVVQGPTSKLIVTLDHLEAKVLTIDQGDLRKSTLELSTIGGTLHAYWNGKAVGGPWDDVSVLPRADGSIVQDLSDTVNAATISIGAANGPVLVNRVRICRGIHYFDNGATTHAPRVFTLGADEYLMVGDNVANSIDSRSWNKAGLPKRAILGIVKPIVGQ